MSILFMAINCDMLLHQKILSFDNHNLPTHKEAIDTLNHVKLLVHIIHACKKYCVIYWKQYFEFVLNVTFCDTVIIEVKLLYHTRYNFFSLLVLILYFY